MKTLTLRLLMFFCVAFFAANCISASAQLKVFISVDMEGIGGIGTQKMITDTGKDYALGRQFMTEEVNAVVAAVFEHGPAEILVNDSHGDMQNLLHDQLDPRVRYVQSNIKPLGMVQGLDETFDAAIFIGYHARAGTENAFMAHTGTGSVQGIWLNGLEVGEGGLNAHYAGAMGVPVILASGDQTFTEQFSALVPARTVATKTAIGFSAANLIHPEAVRAMLRSETLAALQDLDSARPLAVSEPVTLRLSDGRPARADIAMAIPGMRRIDGNTVEYQAESMDSAYRMIRLVYKYISW